MEREKRILHYLNFVSEKKPRKVYDTIKQLLILLETSEAAARYVDRVVYSEVLNGEEKKYVDWVYEFLSERLNQPQVPSQYLIRQESAVQTYIRFANLRNDPRPIHSETDDNVTFQIFETPSEDKDIPSQISFQVKNNKSFDIDFSLEFQVSDVSWNPNFAVSKNSYLIRVDARDTTVFDTFEKLNEVS